MRRVSMIGMAILALSVSPACAQQPGQAPAPPEPYQALRFSEAVDAPFQLEGAWIIVEGVYLNGQGPFRFLLDTGAGGAGRLDIAVVQGLGLQQVGEAMARAPNGGAATPLPVYGLDSLEFGSLRFEGLALASRDYNEAEMVAMRGSRIDGILGIGLFEELLLTIDYPGRRVRVDRGALPAPNGADILALAEGPGLGQVEISVGGVTALTDIDTGAPSLMTVGSDLADRLRWKSTPAVVGRGRTVAGDFSVERAALDGVLVVGDVRLEDPELDIVRAFPTNLIGRGLLQQAVLTIDQQNDRVRLARPGASAAAQAAGGARPVVDRAELNPPTRRYGIGFNPPVAGQTSIPLLEVLGGNVAAEAGLQAGDEILSINGRDVAGITSVELGRYLRGSPLTLVVKRGDQRLNFTLSLD